MRLDAEEIKAGIDLVDYLASLGIELKRAGASGEYRGFCPFHMEAAPSFQVNRRKGLWHCFGCGAGGDVISFVMKRSGVGFRDALAILAGVSGMRGGDILRAAADYWHRCLAGSRSARSYLARRRIDSPEIVKRYRIGFAPGGTKTFDRLLADGFSRQEIAAAGLVNRKGLDSFFGRVTFPLTEDGGTVNIYGRSLSGRYRHMYLPARRDVIFNIDFVLSNHAILTESVIDALSLIALGFDNAVSCLSARLAWRQEETLAARFARVEILFDGDPAGEAGAHATAEQLGGKGIETIAVALPPGSDVNSLLTGGATRQDFEDLLSKGR